ARTQARPQEHKTLDRPRNRHPLQVELNRRGDGEESDCRADVAVREKSVRSATAPSRVEQAREVRGDEECERRWCRAVEPRVGQHPVTQPEVERGVRRRERYVEPARGTARQYVVEYGEQRVEDEEDREEGERRPELFAAPERESPAERRHHRPREGEEVEAAPALEVCDGEYAGVQERDVREERDLVVRARREERGRQESAGESEYRHGQSVLTDGPPAGRRRN